MQKNLSQFSNIVSGYTFRGPVKSQQNGDIYVLQAKNITINEDITSIAEFTRIDSNSLRNPYFLEYNDVLIVSRGSGSFRSTVFVTNDKNVIASSSVYVIRIKDVTVLPKYISLYLNSQEGQKTILQIVTGGSYIQTLLRRSLEDFKVPIPPIHIQKSIIALNENIKQQEKILSRKKEIKQIIINSTFTNLTNK